MDLAGIDRVDPAGRGHQILAPVGKTERARFDHPDAIALVTVAGKGLAAKAGVQYLEAGKRCGQGQPDRFAVILLIAVASHRCPRSSCLAQPLTRFGPTEPPPAVSYQRTA